MPLIHGAAVKDLVQRMRDVAVVFEMLRQRHHIRQAGAEQVLWLIRIEIHAGAVRSQTGEQTEPRRRAERHLAVVRREDCSLRRQPVDVRRLNPRRAVTAEQRLEVVGDDEEDVGLLFWGVVGVQRGQRREQQGGEEDEVEYHGRNIHRLTTSLFGFESRIGCWRGGACLGAPVVKLFEY